MRFVTAWLCAMSASVLAAIVFGIAFRGLNPDAAVGSLSIGVVTAMISLWCERNRPWKLPRPGLWGWVAILVFAFFALRAFLWLIFRSSGEIYVLSPNNLGDMSIHLTYINLFAQGEPFWPDNPIVTGQKLTYPLGVDLFNSLLALVGVDVFRGLIAIGLIGAACTGPALWRWGGAFALAGFLFNGGTEVVPWAREAWQSGEWGFVDIQHEAAWKSIPLALFVTQRGFLYAFPAGLLLLASWRARAQAAPDESWRLPLWTEVLLYGAMPVFHLHTFLFLSVFAAAAFLTCAKMRRHLAWVVGLAFPVATALVLFTTNFFKGPSMLGWHLGWMQTEPGLIGFLDFWLTNFGVLPFLAGALVAALWFEDDRTSTWARTLVCTALGLFLTCCFVKFAVWEWDNTKLMVWCYLAILPPLWQFVLARWPEWLRAIACVLLFASGFISLIGGLSGRLPDEDIDDRIRAEVPMNGFRLASQRELDLMETALRRIPIEERFIAASTMTSYAHPLLLHGRKIVLGYIGHVQSHGYDSVPINAALTSVLNGEPNWRELARNLGARYLFWGREEREAHPNSSQPWRTTAALVAAGEWGEIYDLETPVPPPIEAPSE